MLGRYLGSLSTSVLIGIFAFFLPQMCSGNDLQWSITNILQELGTNNIERKAWNMLEADVDAADSRKIFFGFEGGLAFVNTGSDGQYPNAEFCVDEAKLFVEASIGEETYVFAELNLMIRESDEEDLRLGEIYLDFENISRFWNKEGLLNIRIGRIDIPFGEEYLTRDAIDNPLISHSLSDLWGVDEGVQVYGRMKQVHYVLAIQNGGHPMLNDFNSDKAVVGRIGVDASQWMHLSLSAMRTGAVEVEGDELSELWFGNGFIRALGSPDTTTNFHGNLLQGDAKIKSAVAQISVSGGYLHYDDNDSSADNRRDVYYYHAEGVHPLIKQQTKEVYAAARFSQILANEGFPLVGHGDFGRYFFDPTHLTKSLRQLSLGVGYRFGRKLLLKAEYTFERGEEISGSERDGENFLGAEVALKF